MLTLTGVDTRVIDIDADVDVDIAPVGGDEIGGGAIEVVSVWMMDGKAVLGVGMRGSSELVTITTIAVVEVGMGRSMLKDVLTSIISPTVVDVALGCTVIIIVVLAD